MYTSINLLHRNNLIIHFERNVDGTFDRNQEGNIYNVPRNREK